MKRDSEIFSSPEFHFSLLERPNRHVYVSGLFMGLLRANRNRIYQFRLVLSFCNRGSKEIIFNRGRLLIVVRYIIAVY